MRSFWVFRTNLKNLEYYHNFVDLVEFKRKCHDFYLLQGIWFLENDYFDEVIIWRLSNITMNDIVFDVSGKKFVQKFVSNFRKCCKFTTPVVSLFRGGFPEYGEVTRQNPTCFGLKLYLGSSYRVYPRYNGRYDKILVESEGDFIPGCSPFFKTASPEIFKPLDIQTKKYDLCWVCNFEQITQKGQEFFISNVAQSKYLQSLRIVHLGNKRRKGEKLCKKYNVNNIEFLGQVERDRMNVILNQSKFGIVTSNQRDGSPRVSTEILMSGTPLLVRDQTRLLQYYKKYGVVVFNDSNLKKKVKSGLETYDWLCEQVLINLERFSLDTVCHLNYGIWLQKSK